MTIVKVQLPLASNGPMDEMMIYDKTRAHVSSVAKHDQPEAFSMLKASGEPKAFCYADFRDGIWTIDVARGFAPWQEW
jgi:hypothetical protein